MGKKIGIIETYKTFLRRIITEFERKVDVKNHQLFQVRNVF